MKLTGELKDKVDQTANLEEAKDVIAQAGMLLTDDEVSEVAGGVGITKCPVCGALCRNMDEENYHFAACILGQRDVEPNRIAPNVNPTDAPIKPKDAPAK
jgi:hypothetical protein